MSFEEIEMTTVAKIMVSLDLRRVFGGAGD